MGTRAIIRYKNKPILATHWDGYPDSLGVDLLKLKIFDITNIIRVAKKHLIDSADISILKKVQRPDRTGGNIVSAEDYKVGDIRYYEDWAEYEYNVSEKGVTFRRLHGLYPESLKTAKKFKRIFIKDK